jgi:hypothetical protein
LPNCETHLEGLDKKEHEDIHGGNGSGRVLCSVASIALALAREIDFLTVAEAKRVYFIRTVIGFPESLREYLSLKWEALRFALQMAKYPAHARAE